MMGRFSLYISLFYFLLQRPLFRNIQNPRYRRDMGRRTSLATSSLREPFLELRSCENVSSVVQYLSHHHIMHTLDWVGTAVRDDRHYVFRIASHSCSPQNTPRRAKASKYQRLDAPLLQEIVQARRLERRRVTRPPSECDVVTNLFEQLGRLCTAAARLHGGGDACEPVGVFTSRVRRCIDVDQGMDHLDALRMCPNPHFDRGEESCGNAAWPAHLLNKHGVKVEEKEGCLRRSIVTRCRSVCCIECGCECCHDWAVLWFPRNLYC